ncbi:MAG: 23S rRNA (guanosine(2251)-2'-O)-methyltransferase RlmB [Bacteroidales bacterium]|nr:23S rRNA (guanosine(2251)-2'-O)-methyltransferase RlmB [Bacteroidales bacterium]
MMAKENIIYGIRPILEAIREGKTIEKLLLQTNISNDGIKNIKEELKQEGQNPKIQYVPIEKLNSLTRVGNHQGVVAITSLVEYSLLEDVIEKCLNSNNQPFVVMLDHITDVRNLGAIARTCECAGATCLVVPEEGSAAINEDAIKTSAGALLRLPICKIRNTKSTLNYLRQMGLKIYSASEKANHLYYEQDFKEGFILIMGAEDRGVSKDALKMSDELIRIPINGEIESLNVSVAAGVIIYEAVKQRNIK